MREVATLEFHWARCVARGGGVVDSTPLKTKRAPKFKFRCHKTMQIRNFYERSQRLNPVGSTGKQQDGSRPSPRLTGVSRPPDAIHPTGLHARRVHSPARRTDTQVCKARVARVQILPARRAVCTHSLVPLRFKVAPILQAPVPKTYRHGVKKKKIPTILLKNFP